MRLKRQQLVVPLYLCILCQVIYSFITLGAVPCTARELLFGGLCAAIAVSILLFVLFVLGRILAEGAGTPWKKAVDVLLCILFLCAVVQTVAQQVQIYQIQFDKGVIWVVVLAGCALALRATVHAFLRCARLLFAFCVVVAVGALLGLIGQSDLHNLSAQGLTATGICAGFWMGCTLFPEYFAILIAAPKRQTGAGQGAAAWIAMPFFALGAQFAVVFCAELIFGMQSAGVGGFECLRSWALLNFSRYDGMVVLLWLLIAFFRLRFFAFLAAQVNPFVLQNQEKKVDQK
ncbi:MAG: hypothetical protein R3Y06_02630 [Faecalibacterium sp.]